jgi:hypothetical protein
VSVASINFLNPKTKPLIKTKSPKGVFNNKRINLNNATLALIKPVFNPTSVLIENKLARLNFVVAAAACAFLCAVPNNLRINLSNKLIVVVFVLLRFFNAVLYSVVVLTA